MDVQQDVQWMYNRMCNGCATVIEIDVQQYVQWMCTRNLNSGSRKKIKRLLDRVKTDGKGTL